MRARGERKNTRKTQKHKETQRPLQNQPTKPRD